MTAEALRRLWILLRRSFILHGRALLVPVLIFAAFEAYFVMRVFHPTVWLVFTCIYMSFIAPLPINRDDKFGTAAWSCTLPVTRADLVRGHYATAWALVMSLLVLALLLAVFVPGSKVPPATFLGPNRLLLVAGVLTCVLALLIPFTMRFGLMGLLLVLAVLQIAGAALFVVANVTGSMGAVEGGVAAPFRALAAGISGLRGALPAPVFQLAMLLGLLVVNWASYRLALAFFRRRDL
jgi:hypothetical protein